MNAAIKEVIEKNCLLYAPEEKRKFQRCIYRTEDVSRVASELGVSYDAAKELVGSYIQEYMF